MSTLTFLLAYFFLGLSLSFAAQDACDISEFVSCMEPIHNATLGHDRGLFQDADDLDQSCPILKEGEKCIKSYAERCGTEMIAENFREQFEKPADLIREICDYGSSLRREYLQFSPCFLRHNDDMVSCATKTEEFLSNFEPDTDEKEKTITCMYETILRGCLMSMATDKCGLAGGNFIRKALQYTPAHGLKDCSE